MNDITIMILYITIYNSFNNVFIDISIIVIIFSKTNINYLLAYKRRHVYFHLWITTFS